MTTQEPRYLAYMLRLWQVRDNEEMLWRASLEDARTSERRGFASLEMLVAFLREQVRAGDDSKSCEGWSQGVKRVQDEPSQGCQKV